MSEHVVIVSFDVESEAYQAITELKRQPVSELYVVSQACIVKNAGGVILPQDQLDTGVETSDDTWRGGLIGSFVGILGGPIGVLLGGSMGALIGNTVDAGDTVKNISIIEKVSQALPEGKTALIALVSEESTVAFDARFEKFAVQISREDAAEVAEEIEKAQELQREMEKEARKKLREEKKEDRKQKIEDKRNELKAKFEDFKNRH